jgi:hypothetical protein
MLWFLPFPDCQILGEVIFLEKNFAGKSLFFGLWLSLPNRYIKRGIGSKTIHE